MAKCSHCGSVVEHQGICFTVKAVEYYPDGTVKRVEYKCAGDYGPILPIATCTPPRVNTSLPISLPIISMG